MASSERSWTHEVLPVGHPATSRVAIVVSRKDDRVFVEGSAVLIRPGLIMTARHVVTNALARHHQKTLAPGQDYHLNGRFILNALHPRVDGTYLNWTVWLTRAKGEADLVWVLGRTRNRIEEDQETPIRMTLRRPSIGSRVEAIGYPGAAMVLSVDGSPELALEAVRVTGRVIAPYAERDAQASTLLFQTDAPFNDGMSGGPVFDESGALCGIVSRGWNWDTGEIISSASLLWPALFVELGPFPFEPVTAHQLAAARVLDVFGWQRCIKRGDELFFAADADW